MTEADAIFSVPCYQWIYSHNEKRASFAYSRDLEHWQVICDLINYEDSDPKMIGFQYVSFAFEGDDIVYLCRTAVNGAKNFHDSNYITFHRIENFRDLISDQI